MNTAPAPTELQWFTAKDIARAVGRDKKTVRREARRANWPSRQVGNRQEFLPPEKIARIIIAAPSGDRPPRDLTVRFSDLVNGTEQHLKVLRREEAVHLLLATIPAAGKEAALETVAETMRARYPLDFPCSARALRRWFDAFRAHGLDGLVEQKLGVVGAKAFARDLSRDELLQAAASAIGHGQWKRNKTMKRLNIAEAFRETVANPTITNPDARRWLHGARASKSAYPPSFKRAIRELASPLAATILQVGKAAARLDGPFTNADYSDNCAAHAITADDMTANHYVWLQWKNDRGFVLVRPQILAAMHVGSTCWLNHRVVVNARRVKDGQTTGSSVYDKDDVFGMLGDTFDEFGIFADEFDQPKMVFIFEGGIWQSQIVTGRRVLPDDEQRFGGLRSLGKGIRIIHTRTPLGKAAIEGGFHLLQAAGDDLPGYTGRDARHDMPEQTKMNLSRVKAGQHPRGMFLHLSEYQAHIARTMHNINTTRNDGKICGGVAPLDKFRSLNLRTVVFPDRLKWMYRSAYAINKVTRNGFSVGRKIAGLNVRYEYDHPLLENYRGTKVVAFWNESNPDTDAVIYTVTNGRPDKLICVASCVSNPSRLGASEEDLKAEATRKSLKVSMASSQAKTLAPFLQRNVKLAELAPRAAAIGDKIEGARKEQEQRVQARKNVRKFQGGLEPLLEDNLGQQAAEADQAESVDASGHEPQLDCSRMEVSAAGDDQGIEGLSGKTTVDSPLQQTGENTFDYQLQPVAAPHANGSEKAQYVDYLLDRLTEFRQAGASFGQQTGNISLAVTTKIAKGHLGCDLHDESRFKDVVAYLQGKIDATILGKRNTAKSVPNYHEFEPLSDLSANGLIS